MEWTEIAVSIPVEDSDKAGDIAMMTVPYGYYLEDYSTLEQEVRDIARIDLIDEELLKRDRSKAIIHLYISCEDDPREAVRFLTERLNAAGIHNEIHSSVCDDEDWSESWKKYFKPMDIGNRLLVCPAWENAPNPDNRRVLLIEPGAAFGSGTHETTQLCLQALDGYVRGGESVLDIGCGSGILSLGALLLGAKNAVGVDIDELAVKTARENGKLNGFGEPEYAIMCGSLADKVSGKFDIITANIVADVIISFIPQVGALLKDGGVFITSGIIDSRSNEVIIALESHGYRIIEVKEDGGWICLAAHRGE